MWSVRGPRGSGAPGRGRGGWGGGGNSPPPGGRAGPRGSGARRRPSRARPRPSRARRRRNAPGPEAPPDPRPTPPDPRKPLAPPAPMGLLDAVRPVVRAVCSRSRRSWTNEERAHLDLRVLAPAKLADPAARLEAALAALDAVHWVEVNGYLGRVVVAFDAEALTVADLVAVVETVEAAGGYAERPFPSEIGTH